MPDLQPPVPPAASAGQVMFDPPSGRDDPDYAFGCECADPSLQIAQWGQEARAPGADTN